MAVGFKAAGAVASATSSAAQTLSITPALPTDWVAGDFAILHARLSSTASGTIATPAGWTLFDSRTSGLAQYALYWKRLVDGDTNPTLTDSFSGAAYLNASTSTYTGVRADGSPISNQTTGTDTYNRGNSENGLTWASVTPDQSGLAVAIHTTTRNYSGEENFVLSWQGSNYANNTEWATRHLHSTQTAANTEFSTALLVTSEANSTRSTIPFNYLTSLYNASGAATTYYCAFILAPQPVSTVNYVGTGPTGSASVSQRTNPSYSFTVSLPTGWVGGDLAFMSVAGTATGSGIPMDVPVPAGWDRVLRLQGNNNSTSDVFYRRLVDGDSTWTISSSVTNGNYGGFAASASITVYTGTGLAEPFTPVFRPMVSGTSSQYSQANVAPFDNRIAIGPTSFPKNTRGVMFLAAPTDNAYNNIDSFGQITKRSEAFARDNFYTSHFWVGDITQGNSDTIQIDPLRFTNQQYGRPFSYAILDLSSISGIEQGVDTYSGVMESNPAFNLAGSEAQDTFSGSFEGAPQIRLTATETRDGYKGGFQNNTPVTTPTYTVAQGNMASVAANTSATTKTINVSGISGTTNDIQLMILSVVGTTAVPTLSSSDWVQVGTDVSVGTGTSLLTLRAFYRPWTGNFSTTVSIVLPVGANQSGLGGTSFGFRGASIESLVESWSTASFANYTTTTIPGQPIQSVRANNLLVQGYLHTANATGTPPSGWTERGDYTSTIPSAVSGQAIQLNTSTVAGTTTTTAGNETFSNSTTKSIIAFQFALSGSARVSDRYVYVNDTEDSDSYSGSISNPTGPVTASIVLAATESSDSYEGATYAQPLPATVTLSTTESQDTYSGIVEGPKPITFVGVGQGQYAYASTSNLSGTYQVTPALPSGLKVDDVMLLHWSMTGTNGSSLPTSPPAGWTAIDSTLWNNPSTSSGGDIAHAVYYRFYQAGDGNPTVQAYMPAGGVGNGQLQVAFVSAYSGVDKTSPVEGVTKYSTQLSQDAGGAWGYTPAPITVDRAGRMMLLFESSEVFNPTSSGGPAGFTRAYDSGLYDGNKIETNLSLYDLISTVDGSYSFGRRELPRSSATYPYTPGVVTTGLTLVSIGAAAGNSIKTDAVETPDAYSGALEATPNSDMQLAASENNDSFSAAMAVVASVTLNASEPRDAFFGSSAVTSTANLTTIEARDSYAGSHSINSNTNLAASETNDSFSGSVNSSTNVVFTPIEGYDQWTGGQHIATTEVVFTPTESPDQFYTVLSTRVEMQVAATETRDSYSGSVNAFTTVTLGNVNETGQDSFQGSLNLNTPFTLAAAEANDAFSGSAQAVTTTRLTATETAQDGFSASLSSVTTARLSATESTDTYSGSHAVVGSTNLAATESNDTTQFAFDNRTVMVVQIVEANDSFSGSAAVVGSFTVGATEAKDAFSGSAQAVTPFRVNATEANDTYAGLVQSATPFRIQGVEANDNFSGSAQAVTTASLAASEANDAFSGMVGIVGSLALSGVEQNDALSGNLVSVTPAQMSALEGRDGFGGSLAITSDTTLEASEDNDGFDWRFGVIANLSLAGVETGFDDYTGRVHNDEYATNLYVKNQNQWIVVNPVLVRSNGQWVEPKSGYVRTAGGTWAKIYGKPN